MCPIQCRQIEQSGIENEKQQHVLDGSVILRAGQGEQQRGGKDGCVA
jgi:hypothetical protein